MTTENNGRQSGGPRAADMAIRIAEEAGLELFVTPTGDTYGRIPRGEHKEVHRINSKAFRNWLRDLYYARYHHGFGNNQRDEINDTLEAKAAATGRVENVYVRIAKRGSKLYLDLANDAWGVVEIDKNGWKVREDSPVNFRRPNGMLPLPTPEDSGSINELKEYMEFSTDEEFVLTVSWLIGAYHPQGPYPVLVFIGQAGSGKTTRARLLGMLIDPREPALRVGQPNADSIDIAAKNTHVLIFDNLSNVPSWFSDRLCTLSTGGGSSRRKLYEDDGEVLFDAKRPVILTGIDELATRGDLLDRSLLVYPKRIEQYQPEKTLLADFKRAQPRLLGVILDGVSYALAGYRTIEQGNFRMADFAAWVTAAEEGLGWEADKFVKAYNKNLDGASGLAVEASPVATEIVKLLKEYGGECYDSYMSALLIDLDARHNESDKNARYDRAWPKTAHRLSSDINRIAPNLKAFGIRIEKPPRTNQGQPIRLCPDEDKAV